MINAAADRHNHRIIDIHVFRIEIALFGTCDLE